MNWVFKIFRHEQESEKADVLEPKRAVMRLDKNKNTIAADNPIQKT